MVWQKSWYSKRVQKPNREQRKPTISFRSNLSPAALGYIKRLVRIKAKSNFINQAIEMRYFSLVNKKQFLKQILEADYNLCRFLLRKIGREND